MMASRRSLHDRSAEGTEALDSKTAHERGNRVGFEARCVEFAARCPELPLVLDRLTAVVRAGSALYNKGDHEACRRRSASAARALTDEVIPPHRCPVIRRTLNTALVEAAAAGTADDAAWALRRGFDRIAGSVQPPK